MKRISGQFTAAAADVDEKAIEARLEASRGGLSELELAESTVRALSRAKALAVFDSLGRPADTLVIGADTVVALESEILGKPSDREDAVRMLREQSRQPQYVLTGVTFVTREGFTQDACCCSRMTSTINDAKKAISNKEDAADVLVRTFVERSVVYFKPLDEEQEARIQAYCDTDEPYDKAGAYGIQLNGAALVDRFEGDFDNIVGFPVLRVKQEMDDFLKINNINSNN